jgi:hypothetical protein
METLWVEPRLRGFMVSDDARNPAGTAGKNIPYDLGWVALVGGGGDVPRHPQVEPLRGVRLRVASPEMRTLARRAMEREFASRLRAGELNVTVRTATWKRLMPWGVCALGLALGLFWAQTVGWAMGLMFGVMMALTAAVLWGFAKVDTASVRVDGDHITFHRLDGRVDRRPLSSIEHMSPGMGGGVMRFVDGASAHLDISLGPARTLFRAIRRVYAPDSEARDNRQTRRAMIRSLLIYWPLGSTVIGVAHWYLGANNGWSIPGRPILSAALSALTVCFAFGAVLALQYFQPTLVRWNAEREWRKQRRKMKAKRGSTPGATFA